MDIFSDDKIKPFHCSEGNFRVLFPEMLQDLWGYIIPAAGIWLLKTPSSSKVLRWVKVVHSESFLSSLGNCRQLRLTLPQACLMSGVLSAPSQSRWSGCCSGHPWAVQHLGKNLFFLKISPEKRQNQNTLSLLPGVNNSERACVPTEKGNVCVTWVPADVWSGLQLLLLYSEVFEKRCPTSYKHQQKFSLFS